MLLRFLIFFTCIIPLEAWSQTHYVDKAAEVGVNHSYGIGVAGGGVSLVDINGDGWDDLSLASQEGDVIKVYLNNNGIFELQSNLALNNNESKQILWVDLDNDGDKDLFITVLEGINRIFENIGNLTMVDITPNSGLPFTATSTYGAIFGDYDRDGYLDLYYGEKTLVFSTNQGHLFRNNGDLTFTEITGESNTTDLGKAPFCSVFFDLENDGWPDIYTAHDKTNINTLLRNNGDGTYTDASVSSGADMEMNAMGIAVGDYDNNGFLDLYISNTPIGNALLQNNGDSTFDEVAVESGTLFEGIGWSCNFLDVDNDGFLDLYVTATVISDISTPSTLYMNLTDGTFAPPSTGFTGDTVTVHSHAIGDFNNDGYPDIFTNPFDEAPAKVWENQGGNHHFIKVSLEGVISNRDGIGSFIEVFANGNRYIRYTHCGVGYLGQNSNTEIIGIGEASAVDSIRVKWSSGHIDVLYNPTINELHHIVEGSTTNGDIQIEPGTGFDNETTSNTLISSSSIHIYPNPTDQYIHIDTQNSKERFDNVQILGLDGTVLSDIPFINKLDLGNIPNGTYLLRLSGKEGIHHFPFIKHH